VLNGASGLKSLSWRADRGRQIETCRQEPLKAPDILPYLLVFSAQSQPQKFFPILCILI
jgi:hypothetical protein